MKKHNIPARLAPITLAALVIALTSLAIQAVAQVRIMAAWGFAHLFT
jgi:hypothetical protein